MSKQQWLKLCLLSCKVHIWKPTPKVYTGLSACPSDMCPSTLSREWSFDTVDSMLQEFVYGFTSWLSVLDLTNLFLISSTASCEWAQHLSPGTRLQRALLYKKELQLPGSFTFCLDDSLHFFSLLIINDTIIALKGKSYYSWQLVLLWLFNFPLSPSLYNYSGCQCSYHVRVISLRN